MRDIESGRSISRRRVVSAFSVPIAAGRRMGGMAPRTLLCPSRRVRSIGSMAATSLRKPMDVSLRHRRLLVLLETIRSQLLLHLLHTLRL